MTALRRLLARVTAVPPVAAAIAAYRRYGADGGDRLAASISYFAFLSFFPLVALAFSVLGIVLSGEPGVRRDVQTAIGDFLPGLVGSGSNQISLDAIAGAKAKAGAVGLVGLLLSGMGWVNALRQSIHVVWHEQPNDGNPLQSRARQLVTLLVLGVAVLGSVVLTSGATFVTGLLLDAVGLHGSLAASVLTRVLGVAVALAVDAAVLVYLFTLVPRDPGGWREVLPGAVLGGVLIEALKAGGALLLGHTTHNPLYGPFAVVVGLLVWVNVLARVLMLSAAWTVLRLEALGRRAGAAVALPQEPTATVLVRPAGEARAARAGRDLGFAALGALVVTTAAVVARGARAAASALPLR